MHTLYDYLFSGNGWKVRRTLRLLGIAHHWVEVDILAGETRAAAHLQRNPAGEIPVLALPDGTCLAESHAILLYLAEGTPWLPGDRRTRAEVHRWLCFEQTHIDGVISRARFRRCFPEVIPTTQAQLRGWWKQGESALALIEAHLSQTPWLAGRPSIADIAVSAYVQVADQAGHELSRWPVVCAWLQRVHALPGHIPIDERPAATWQPDRAPTVPRPIGRGDLYWAHTPRWDLPTSDRAHPHLVIQDDVLNRSRIDTVVAVALTTKLSRANEPGNLLLDEGEGQLPKRSAVVVSQLSTVAKSDLGAYIGSLSASRVDQVLDGLRFQQRAGFVR